MTRSWSSSRHSLPVSPSDTVSVDCSRSTGWLRADGGAVDRAGQAADPAGDHQPRARIGHREVVGARPGVAAVVAAAERQPECAAGHGDRARLLDADRGLDQGQHRGRAAESVDGLGHVLGGLGLGEHHAREAGKYRTGASTSSDQKGVVRSLIRTHADVRPATSRRRSRAAGFAVGVDGVLDVEDDLVGTRLSARLERVGAGGVHQQPRTGDLRRRSGGPGSVRAEYSLADCHPPRGTRSAFPRTVETSRQGMCVATGHFLVSLDNRRIASTPCQPRPSSRSPAPSPCRWTTPTRRRCRYP